MNINETLFEIVSPDLFEYPILGIITVFITLLVIASLTSIVSFTFKWFSTRIEKESLVLNKTESLADTKIAKTRPEKSHDLPQEIVVVIAAAVHEACQGRPHRILRISESTDTNWLMGKRYSHHFSHKVR